MMPGMAVVAGSSGRFHGRLNRTNGRAADRVPGQGYGQGA